MRRRTGAQPHRTTPLACGHVRRQCQAGQRKPQLRVQRVGMRWRWLQYSRQSLPGRRQINLRKVAKSPVTVKAWPHILQCRGVRTDSQPGRAIRLSAFVRLVSSCPDCASLPSPSSTQPP
jgi:hypothetical protein